MHLDEGGEAVLIVIGIQVACGFGVWLYYILKHWGLSRGKEPFNDVAYAKRFERMPVPMGAYIISGVLILFAFAAGASLVKDKNSFDENSILDLKLQQSGMRDLFMANAKEIEHIHDQVNQMEILNGNKGKVWQMRSKDKADKKR